MTLTEAAHELEAHPLSLRQNETGRRSGVATAESYETLFQDEILLYLASDHPVDCDASRKKQRQLEAELLKLQGENALLKKENAQIYGVLTRWKRILLGAKLFHLVAEPPRPLTAPPRPLIPARATRLAPKPALQPPVVPAVPLVPVTEAMPVSVIVPVSTIEPVSTLASTGADLEEGSEPDEPLDVPADDLPASGQS